MKKILSMVLAVTMIFTLCIPAFAAEVEPYEDDSQMVVVEGPITRAADIPDELHALPYTATTEDLTEGAKTLTKYYFKPNGTSFTVSGTITPAGNMNNKSRYAELYLYEVGSNELIDTHNIAQFASETEFSHTFQNLSSNKHYYFALKNTTGYVFPWDNFWISASFTIS